jgi:ribosomal protein L35
MFKHFATRTFSLLRVSMNLTMSSMNSVGFKSHFYKEPWRGLMSNNIGVVNRITSTAQSPTTLIKFQRFGMRSMKTKRKDRASDPKYKVRNHNGLMKRVRVVGPRWNRAFKYWANNHSHKMIKKSSRNLALKKRARYVPKCYFTRFKRLIPLFKRQRYRN